MFVHKTCLTFLESHLAPFICVLWLSIALVLGHAQRMDVSIFFHAYTKSKDAKVPPIQWPCSYMSSAYILLYMLNPLHDLYYPLLCKKFWFCAIFGIKTEKCLQLFNANTILF